jgi:LmbE family N-acetylglucosaminyl deacetylase
MALRRDEDATACALVGAEVVHLPFPEAPHRGYENAQALFAGVRADEEVAVPVLERFAVLIQEIRPDSVLAPLGLGGHVDHLIVREAVHAAARGLDLQLWEDWPYVERLRAHDRDKARLVTSDAVARSAKLSACSAYGSQLNFQFGGIRHLRRMLSVQSGEWLHPVG